MILQRLFIWKPGRICWVSRFKSFTLIELMLVITVIAVLVSLLMPAINKAKNTAKMIRCSANMKQIGLAVNSYTDDYQGWMPFNDVAPGTSYYFKASPYLCGKTDSLWTYFASMGKSTVLYCPENTEVDFASNQNYSNYSFNIDVLGSNTHGWANGVRKITEFRYPTKNSVLFDASSISKYSCFGLDTNITIDNAGCAAGFIHNRQVNSLFVDGHVNAMKKLYPGQLLPIARKSANILYE